MADERKAELEERQPPSVERSSAESPRPTGALLADLDEIEIEVEKVVAGGDGLGRYEGVPIFIPLSAPGDRLRARIVERRADYGRAEIVEILSPGEGRKESPCPYYGRCGGCNLQHLEDRVQGQLRAAATMETLVRLGGVDPGVELSIVLGDAWGYRLRARLQVRADEEGSAVGYLARRSTELVEVSQCPILVPELEGELATVAAAATIDGPRRIDLAAGGDGRVTTAPVVPGLPHGAVEMELGEFSYRFDARCFFQAHRQLLPKLVQTVVGEWSGSTAVDLYAGAGLFSLPLSRLYEAVQAVEGDRIALRYASMNGRRNRCSGLRFTHRSVETWVTRMPPGLDRVVVDPPRAGLGKPVRRALLEYPAKRLTYASCHAATLARDLRSLQEAYELESLTLLDMFPQTGHMEVVAQLSGRS